MPHRTLAASLLVVVTALAAGSCDNAAAKDPRTEVRVVRTAIVEDGQPAARSFTGVVAARVQSDLGFRVSGKVVERLVDVGETVRRGQPLMRLDATDLKLSADAQSEAVEAARARVRQASERTDQIRDLRDSDAASDSEYDEAKAAERAAKAELDAVEDQADIARNASEYAVLFASSAGVVVEATAEPGQVVSAGQTVIQLAESGPREAVIQLPEAIRPEIGSTAQATLFGSDDDPAPATLRELAGSADQVTRTFDARYVLDGELADATLGSTVTIEIPVDDGAGADGLRVPIAAVLDEGDGPGVWVVEGTPAKTAWRPVTIERLDGDSAHVSGDVARGDRVVAMGAHLIRDGERVRIDAAVEDAPR